MQNRSPVTLFIPVGLFLACIVGLLWTAYALWGANLITSMYDGTSLVILNKLVVHSRTLEFHHRIAQHLLFNVSVILYAGTFFIAVKKTFPHKQSLFTPRSCALIALGFLVIVFSVNTIMIFAMNIFKYYGPAHWPISICIHKMPTVFQMTSALCLFILLRPLLTFLRKHAYSLPLVLIFGCLFIILSTTLQGIEGFTNPILEPMQGNPNEQLGYYIDAVKITDPLHFLSSYNNMQSSFAGGHTETHPPGPLLFFYLLAHLTSKNPALIALLIACIAACGSMFFLSRILQGKTGNTPTGYYAFLFSLIPSIQIYYLATIDAIIATLLLGTLYAFLHKSRITNICGTLLFLFLATFCTFTTVFMFPVLVLIDLMKNKNIIRSMAVICGLVLMYVLLTLTLNYNHITAFMTAAARHNRGGLAIVIFFSRYVLTIFEAIAEVLLFCGPFLLILAWKKYRTGSELREVRALFSPKKWLLTQWKDLFPYSFQLSHATLIALGTFVFMALGGMFHTGETARICLFLYPYLLFPVVQYLSTTPFGPREETFLAYGVFSQTIIMQLFGNYLW